jgi:acyl-CoA synthetase (AMP-forming)/AMP-acid ligase II
MELTGVPAIPPDVLESYVTAGRWDQSGLRAGIEQRAARTPAKVALADAARSWSYAQLEDQVARAAACLRQHGVADGTPVLVIAPLVAEAVITYQAIIRSGGVAVMLDRKCGQADVRHALGLVDCALTITTPALADRLGLASDGPPVLSFDALVQWPDACRDWPDPDPRAPRAVVFTSGTTSRPKAVVHSLNTIRAGAQSMARSLDLTSHDAAFLSTPVASITGLVQVHLTLDRGARLILEDHFEPAGSLERLRAQQASVLGGAPVIIEELFREAERRKVTTLPLRAICLGGTMIPRPVLTYAIEHFGITPVRVYGSSETPCATTTAPSDLDAARIADDGVCAPGVELTTDGPLPGELMIRGPMRFLGYLDAADNREAFAAGGWFRTGDLGIVDRGRLTVTGRVKEIVSRKGMKISLAEVDEAAISLAGVQEAACYGVPDSQTGERLVLAVRYSGVQASFAAITRQLRSAGLAAWKLPEQIVFWTEPLPRTSSGKVQRRAVAAGASGRPCEQAARLQEAG